MKKSDQLEGTCDYIVVSLMREEGASGVQTHISMATQALRELGCSVTVITPFSGRSLLRTLVFSLRYLFQYVNGSLEVFWLRHWHYVYLRRALRHHLEKTRYVSVIYAHCPLSAKAAIEVRGTKKIPVVLAVHFNGSQAFEWLERGKIRGNDWVYRGILTLEEQLVPRVDLVVFVSDYMRRVVHTRIPTLDGARTVVIANFVTEPDLHSLPHVWDLIAVGTLEPRKNQQYILHVVAMLKNRGIKVTLAIVGDGEDRSRLKALARSMGIEKQVTFHGAIRNPAHLMQQSSLLVHGSRLESFGLVLIEAMSVGVPIVAAPVGGIPEILISGINGLFWDLTDVVQGADIVQQLLSDRELLQQMGQSAKELYRQRFSLQAGGAKLFNTLTRAKIQLSSM